MTWLLMAVAVGFPVEAPCTTPAHVKILPPLSEVNGRTCEDPVDEPDRQEIMRALPPVARGVPYVFEVFRDDLDFQIDKLVDRIDAPRFYPLVGTARLHHVHYKCTVWYTETIRSSFPVPFQCKTRRTEVVYIDKDHLRMVASPVNQPWGSNRPE